MRNRNRLWTAEEIATLARLVHAGKRDLYIANVIGRTRKAVEHKRLELGISDRDSAVGKPRSPLTPEQQEDIAARAINGGNAAWEFVPVTFKVADTETTRNGSIISPEALFCECERLKGLEEYLSHGALWRLIHRYKGR